MTNPDYHVIGYVMDPVFTNATYDEYLAMVKENFLDTYNSNRAPRGFYWHWRFMSIDNNFGLTSKDGKSPLDSVKIKFYKDFYSWVVTLPNVIFATEVMIIEWMKNPVYFESTKIGLYLQYVHHLL